MKLSPKTKVTVIVVLVLAAGAGFMGWRLGHKSASTGTNSTVASSNQATDLAASGNVSSLVSYVLPDGWKEGTCPSAPNKVFIVPTGAALNCDSAAIAPIRIYIDPQNTTDCQQLNSPQGARKHICKSLYIGGHKSLQASTTTENTTSDYYIDTGKGVVRVEYIYGSNNAYQTGFDQLANSVKVK